MIIENHSSIPDSELLKIFKGVISKTDLPKRRKDALRKNAYIAVYNGKYSAVNGRIFVNAYALHRQGKEIRCETYIKLFVFSHTTLTDLTRTFAHELSHYRDWWIEPSIRMPKGKEARAKAYADRVINKLKRTTDDNNLPTPD